MIHFPKPLRPGDLIAITAPSSGVEPPMHARLDLVIDHLRNLGYRTVEGECLRNEYKNASAPREKRARELMTFLCDPDVSAIFPPWGGELASELLTLLDFERLRTTQPKWVLGFSDVSTLLVPLTLIAGWATAHGSNMMDLAPTQTDPLTTSTLPILASDFSTPVRQYASAQFQKKWVDFARQPDAPLNLTEVTQWHRLNGSPEPVAFKGRLIGGCLDTIAWLADSKYGDIPRFIKDSGQTGTVLYLENVEMAPTGLVRALLALRRSGWFEGLSGLLIGRSAGPVPEALSDLSYVEALTAALGDSPFPILFDVDIGHQPPQFTLINGAIAEVSFDIHECSITQYSMA